MIIDTKTFEKHPVASGLIAAFGATPVLMSPSMSGAMVSIPEAAILTAPYLCGVATAISLKNMTGERSALSKTFAAAGGVVAGGSLALGLSIILDSASPDLGKAIGHAFTAIGMTAGSAFNIASHYTRNAGPSFTKIKNRITHNDDGPQTPQL